MGLSRFVFVALALVGLCRWTTAQSPGIIRALKVEGNQQINSDQILSYADLKIGVSTSSSELETARQKLLATELFDDVTEHYRFSHASPITYDVTLIVKEAQPTFPMRFERLGGSSESDLKNYLREHVPLYSDRIPGNEGVLKRYTAAVQDFTHIKDPDLKIKAVISNDDPKQLTVVFSSSAPAPTISQVTVSGNQAIDTGTLLRAANSSAVGQPVSDVRLPSIIEGALKPVYAAKGYAAVSFPKIETEPSHTDRGLVVHVIVKEGPQFRFGPVRFRGEGVDEEEIRSNIVFKPGQVYDEAKADDFRLELTRRMRRRGLLDASIDVTNSLDETKRTVNLTYTVIPGAVYRFSKLELIGLDVVSESAINRLWGETIGSPFNPEYPDFFLKRVEEGNILEHLSGTRSDYTADNSSHTVTVRLYFKGGESKRDREQRKKVEQERNGGPPEFRTSS